MFRKRTNIYGLLILYLLNSGCVALVVGAGAGAAGVIWHEGKLQETVEDSVPHVHQAIKAGLRDLNITITEDKSDNLTAAVRGILADGTKVWVDAESTGSSTAKLTIRVGILGDKPFSLRIRDAIKSHL